MNIQLILAVVLGLGACLYLLKKIGIQFHQSDVDMKCAECDLDIESEQTDK